MLLYGPKLSHEQIQASNSVIEVIGNTRDNSGGLSRTKQVPKINLNPVFKRNLMIKNKLIEPNYYQQEHNRHFIDRAAVEINREKMYKQHFIDS